jgi:hypothetical protein
MSLLALVAFLAPVAHAADPKAAPKPATPAQKEQVKTQAAALPPARLQASATPVPISFTPQTSFGAAIDILRNSTKPPLNIVVLWKQIGENAGIYRDTPIGIDGLAGLQPSQYLDLLVLSLSAGASARLGYVVDNGVITIGTRDSLPPPKLVARVYDISDLVAPPGRYFQPPTGFGMGYGSPMTPPGGYAPRAGAGSYGLGSSSLSYPTGAPYRISARSSRAYRSR